MNELGFRALVIDDDPDVAEYTRAVLERKAGCDVRVLNDPSLVRALVREFQPDVVVTDIEMPGMTGLELIAQLHEDQPGLPVVVMTAHASVEYAVDALRRQANEFLTKPISSSHLGAVVVRLASEWRASKETEEELRRAAEVQQGLLPQRLVDLSGYQLTGGCTPAQAVGGDFYDWYPVDDGVAFTLADVMGKGIGAAIIAATVRAVLRSGEHSTDASHDVSSAALALDSDLQQAGVFVTLFHGRLDAPSGEIRYIDAGHGLTLVVRADGGAKRLATTSLPLGLGLGGGWREHVVTLSPGDTLVSTSDGVLDLYDGSLAALDEVEAITRSARSAQEVVDALLAIAVPGAPDDVTVVALRRDS
jgi:sigma-B regulation protein RsbU (phosphoserine phosphatase)